MFKILLHDLGRERADHFDLWREPGSADTLIKMNKDYDDTIDTFLKYWKYFVFYKLNNNRFIYTNNISDIDNKNYAIKWNGDDIDQFKNMLLKISSKD